MLLKKIAKQENIVRNVNAGFDAMLLPHESILHIYFISYVCYMGFHRTWMWEKFQYWKLQRCERICKNTNPAHTRARCVEERVRWKEANIFLYFSYRLICDLVGYGLLVAGVLCSAYTISA